jgi:hypothetical protein
MFSEGHAFACLGAVRAGLELKRACPYEMCVQRGFDSMPRLVVR